MAIRFSAKEPSGPLSAKDKKPVRAADMKEEITPRPDSATDLFEPGGKKSPAKGRKKK